MSTQWDGSFEQPKHMLELMGKKIFTILHWKICLSKPVHEKKTSPHCFQKSGWDSNAYIIISGLHCIFLCPQRNFGRHIVIALSVRPSVSPSVRQSVPLSCPVHISYILWGRNSKFGVWIHLGMAECRVPFSGHCDLDLDLWPSF